MDDIVSFGSSMSSFYSSNSTSNTSICSINTDCLNNGTCDLINVVCVCVNGYWGTNCNFSQATSTKAIQQNSQLLDQMNSSINVNDTNQTNLVCQTLIQMTSVKEINDDNTVNKTFNILDTLTNGSNAKSGTLIINAISNIIDIVSTPNKSNSSSAQMGKAIGLVDKIIDSQLNNNNKSNSPIIISSPNIEIRAAKLDYTNQQNFNSTLNSVLNSNNSSPNVTKVTINDEFISKIKDIPNSSISLTKWTSNPYASTDSTTNITTSVVSFEVKDASHNAVSIKNLTSPLTIQMNKNDNSDNNNPNKTYDCQYWDKNNSKWSKDGVSLLSKTNSSIQCNVNHLTDFGAAQITIIQTNNYNNNNNNINVNTDIWYTTDQNFGVWASVIYYVFFLFIATVLSCHKFSKYESKIIQKNSKDREQGDQTLDPINMIKSPDLFAKRSEESNIKRQDSDKSKKIYNISPLYSIYNSKSNVDCRRKFAGFILYIMLVSMFLACLYSSPDLDVRKN